jgi:hypothetical protein
MSEYDVDGIPHFVFLDGAGRKQGAVIGRLPKEVLRSNADALVQGVALPYAKASGACCLYVLLWCAVRPFVGICADCVRTRNTHAQAPPRASPRRTRA